MLPVNISEPWYSEKGLQVLEEIEKGLSRPRRFIGLLIAGIAALVTIIATAATAAVALSQSIQTRHYVNELSKNVTTALCTQEDIDRKLAEKVNALFDMIQYIGQELVAVKIRMQLQCHAKYHWICISPKQYNDSQIAWEKIQSHLQGIWHDANESINILQLHQEIQAEGVLRITKVRPTY
uniref:Retroviral envelope protein GP41-like domain-containing protein n=1 Tax=Molossus molossus TaxID=27622 RepID=A0A7J8F9L2_MOLMO|nr:hypothetical protein HJG59_008561 [Molossus molossus]